MELTWLVIIIIINISHVIYSWQIILFSSIFNIFKDIQLYIKKFY